LKYKKFCGHLDYVSQDFGKYDGNGDLSGLQTGAWTQNSLDIISDITSIPEKNEAFDAIMCIEVLEHLPDPISALKELTRLLKISGKLILTAPFCSLTHYSPYYYQTGYSRYFYEHWLSNLDYKILDLEVNGNYFEYLAQEIHRIPSIGKKYSGQKIGRLKLFLLNHMLGLQEQLSKSDSGSNELLSFGLHVFAEKM